MTTYTTEEMRLAASAAFKVKAQHIDDDCVSLRMNEVQYDDAIEAACEALGCDLITWHRAKIINASMGSTFVVTGPLDVVSLD